MTTRPAAEYRRDVDAIRLDAEYRRDRAATARQEERAAIVDKFVRLMPGASPAIIRDLEQRSDAYVLGMLSAARQLAAEADLARVRADAQQARAAMIERQRSAWQPAPAPQPEPPATTREAARAQMIAQLRSEWNK